jgi:hypothetical protein
MAIVPKKSVAESLAASNTVASETAVPELSAPEKAAIASAKIKTRNGSTHIEKARAQRLAEFNKNKA